MRSIIVFIFCISGVVSARAQTHSLDYYLSNAVANSPAISAQRNSADSARLQKKIIHADLNHPYISASGDYNYAPYSDHWGYDPAITDGGHYDALINASYPLFTGKHKRVRLQGTAVSIKQNAFQVKQIKHNLRRSVTDQYITAYQDLRLLQSLKDILDLLQRQKNVMHALTKQGVTKITDFKQFNIQRQSTRIAEEKARTTYLKDLLKLKTMSGLSDSTGYVQLQRPHLAIDSSAVGKSRFIKKYRLDSLNIVNQQQVSELKYQPTVSLFGNTGLNAVKFTGIQNRFGFSAGVHFSVPIYDGHKRSLHRQQSQLQQKSVDTYQYRFKQKRNLQLAGLRSQLRQINQQLNLLRRQITQYKDLLDNYRKELKQGLTTTVNYLIVLRQYANARQQQVQATGNLLKLKNEYNYWNW